MTKRKSKKGGKTLLFIALGLGAVVVGAFVFKDKICSYTQLPLLCKTIPSGGGTQMTPAGIRYLEGSEDLPPIT